VYTNTCLLGTNSGSDGAFVEGDFSISREGISISSSGTFGGTTTPSAALSTTGAPVPAVTLPVSLVLPGTPDRERVSIDNVPSPKVGRRRYFPDTIFFFFFFFFFFAE